MGISIWQLLIVLVIVLLLFGTKRLRNLGSDLGSAVKGFKSAVTDGSKEADAENAEEADKLAHENRAEGETVEAATPASTEAKKSESA